MARELFGRRILAAFLLSSFLFTLIFIGAYGVSYWNYQSLSHQTNILEDSITKLDSIIARFDCDDSLLISSSDIFEQAAFRLTLLEKRFGKNDARVLKQKELYTELQYRHFLITKKFNDQCNSSFFPLFFFYSNVGDLEEESERMGFILTAFEREDAERIVIYSFDFNLDSSVISLLRQTHNVTRAPYVVVNEKNGLYVRSIEDLASYAR